jgi:hypothetical protein
LTLDHHSPTSSTPPPPARLCTGVLRPANVATAVKGVANAGVQIPRMDTAAGPQKVVWVIDSDDEVSSDNDDLL